jgi:hypothetical protein
MQSGWDRDLSSDHTPRSETIHELDDEKLTLPAPHLHGDAGTGGERPGPFPSSNAGLPVRYFGIGSAFCRICRRSFRRSAPLRSEG